MDINALQDRDIPREFRVGYGMNDRYKRINLPEDRSSMAVNWRIFADGSAQIRPGATLYKTLASSATCHGIYQFIATSQRKAIICHGTNAYEVTTEGSLTPTAIKTGLPDVDTDATQFRQLGTQIVIITYGNNAIQKWDGTTWAALGGTPLNSVMLTTFKRHVFLVPYANQDRVRFSAIDNAESWTAADEYIISPNTGDLITGLVEYNDNLYILRQNGISSISGSDRTNFRVTNRIAQTGCAAYRSIQTMNDLLIFLGDDKRVYAYNGTDMWEVSYDIPNLLDRINGQYLSQAVSCRRLAGSLNEYWLAVPLDTASTNTDILIANFDVMTRVPGAKGLQPSWSWMTGTNTKCSALAQVQASMDKSRIVLSGDATAVILKRDDSTATTDNGTNYDCNLLTREIGDLVRPRRLKKCKFAISSSSSTYDIDLKIEINQSQKILSNTNLNGAAAGARWGIGVWGVDRWPGNPSAYPEVVPDREQGPGYTYSFRFSKAGVNSLTSIQSAATIEDIGDPYTSGRVA